MPPDFDYIDTGSGYIVEWTSEIDSAHKIGPSTHWKDVLTVDGALTSLRYTNMEIGMIRDIFEYTARASGYGKKWMAPAESPWQIGLDIRSYRVLIVVGGASSED